MTVTPVTVGPQRPKAAGVVKRGLFTDFSLPHLIKIVIHNDNVTAISRNTLSDEVLRRPLRGDSREISYQSTAGREGTNRIMAEANGKNTKTDYQRAETEDKAREDDNDGEEEEEVGFKHR